jgi:hypothetical protein
MKQNDNNSKIAKSVQSYIDRLHEQNSKLLVLRVDFSYGKEHSQSMGLKDIKRDTKHLLDNRRGNQTLFAHQLGYVMKFENAPEKGPHVHALLIFDGQQVQKDAYLADQIGHYWKENITEGKGLYHNCNRNKGTYEQCGVGMVDYSDTDKRSVLSNRVVPYMLKPEQSIDTLKVDGKERSVTKGVAPRGTHKAGRPRKHALNAME